METRDVAIAVGGRVLRFQPVDEETACVLLGVARGFVVEPSEPADCVVECVFGTPRPDTSAIVAEAPPVWEMRRRPSGAEEITFFAADGADRVAFAQLLIDASRESAQMIRRREKGDNGVFRIGFPLDEFLMCRLAAAEKALVVHGAAVEWQGQALLFIGHSGAGKSTIAGLARDAGARVLSDDRSLIRMNTDPPTLWGTPWHGSLREGHPANAPLVAAFLLTQSPHDRIEPLSPSRAAGEVLVRLIFPGASPGEFEGLVDATISLATRVPMAELSFTPTVEAFRLAVQFATEQARGVQATLPNAV